jgi:aliphatic sulfonates family ABC transporter substrate-binding protein
MPLLELHRPDAPAFRARALVFQDPLSLELLRTIERIAPTDATVLVTGETGTGKEIVARHIHERSARAAGAFVAVNCGALTPTLIESELFGHEKSAFTGALVARPGWFESANGGTLFLDEIGDLPLAAQVKLLRVLQEREVVRVGARRALPIDVRLIAATNANLERDVATGKFREDLYYRLHVAHLAVAPLRDRPGDVVPLARHFLRAYAERLGITAVDVSPDAVRRLLAHPWPGNIRELENVMHHALLLGERGRIEADDLRLTAGPSARATTFDRAFGTPAIAPDREREIEVDATSKLEAAFQAVFEEDGPEVHARIERALFGAAFRYSDYNQLQTARLLGISRNVVRARLAQYGLLPSTTRARPERFDRDGADADRATPPESAPIPREVGSPAPRRTGGPVRVGFQPFGVLSLLKVTRALDDVFAPLGATVDWIAYASGLPMLEALAAGSIDLGVVGEAPPIFAQAAMSPFVYLASEPPAPEGEAIVVLEQAAAQHVGDLRGKTIAVTRGSNVLYFLVRALEESGLSFDDVELRMLPPDEGRAAFLRGDVEAWAIWNPLLASVRRSIPTRVLRDAKGLATNRALYVGRRAFADAHPDLVAAFLGQVGATGRWANDSRGAAARALAPQVDLAADAIEAALEDTPFDVRPIDREVVVAQQHIADTFHRLRLITYPLRVNDAVWAPPWHVRRSSPAMLTPAHSAAR